MSLKQGLCNVLEPILGSPDSGKQPHHSCYYVEEQKNLNVTRWTGKSLRLCQEEVADTCFVEDLGPEGGDLGVRWELGFRSYEWV